jgi:hypothetical protein
VWLRPSDAGTALRIELGGVPAEATCRLVVVDRDGRREVAASWRASYSGTASVDGSTAFPAERLASLRVETDAGTLLSVPLS